MANDKLINHTQGETIIGKLTAIADSLEDLTAISPAKFGMGLAVTNTAASTAAKTANIANFILTEGGEVNITFTYANTAANATLNINNTGAKPILYKGSPITADIISAGDTCTFIYSSANGGSYNIINIDALSGAGAGTVKSVGASTGLKTDQTGGAAINMTGTVKLDLTSETPFEGTAPNPVEIEDKIYPVALDAAGHPAVSVPGTEYTQGAGINISENNVITNTGVFDVTAPTSSDTTATNGDIKVTKKVVNNGVTSESVEFVKPKGINDPAFKSLDSSTSGLTSDDNHVPTSKTVQDAIDTALASASIYKGTISAFNDLPTSTPTDTVRKGWYYRVSTAWSAATGTPATHVGDIIIAEKDSPSKAIDSANWSLLHNEANTDANVIQSPVSTNANYEVLFSGSADNTSHTEGTGKDSGLTYNPSTNKLTVSGEVSATSYSGLPDGNTTTKGIVQLGTDADKAASGNHGHGNITNGGALQTTDVAIASGDKLVITDASDSNKVARASVSFDGSTATQALTKKGTFENFQAPISASNKLSSDFVDDTNKTHRFATADQLTQIATNKTNILYVAEDGVKNVFPVASGTTSHSDGTLFDKIALHLSSGSWDFSWTSTATPTAGTVVAYDSNKTEITRISVPSGSTSFSGTLTLSQDAYYVTLYVGIDTTVSNIMCKPSWMSDDYQPPALPNSDLTYLQAEDRAALAEEIDAGAKNKLNFDITSLKALNTSGTWSGNSYTKNGVTFTYNESTKTISTYGTSNAGNTIFYLMNFTPTSGTSYTISGCPSGGSATGYRFCNMGDTWTNDYGSSATAVGNGTLKQMAIYINNSGTAVGTSSNPLTWKLMICTKAAFGVSQKFVPFGNDPFYQVPINHNMIYRGRNLGASLTDAQHTALSSGNFTDLYLGDYWTKTVTIPAGTYTGGDGKEVTVPAQTNITLKAVIADFDTFYAGYDSNYAGINTHHAAVIVTGFSNVVWNKTDTTDGGYANSLINKWLVGSALPQIETWFGSAKVLSHTKLLTIAITDSAASRWDWISQKISLLSENQVYGSKVWGNSKAANGGCEPGEAFKHLNVFNHIGVHLLFGNKPIWLRDIATAWEASLFYQGYAFVLDTSNPNPVPAALILLS